MSFAEQVAMGMDGSHRSDANKARDQYRHPAETLEFFGIKDGMKKVVVTNFCVTAQWSCFSILR